MLTLIHRSERTDYREVDLELLSDAEIKTVLTGLNRICKPIVGAVEPVSSYPHFSVRAENTLKRCRIETFGDLVRWNKQFPGAGRKTYEEFRVALESYGLELPPEIFRYLKRKGGA